MAASAATAVRPEAPAPAPKPEPEIGLGALQLAAGYAIEIGGVAGMIAGRIYPKTIGIHSDFANLAFVVGVVPTLAAGTVCATGLLSQTYRGRCLPTFMGAYAGAIVGGLLGIAVAPAPGPDDTSSFMQSVFGMLGVMAFSPLGAVIGYHAGKQPIDTAPTASATAPLDLTNGLAMREGRAASTLAPLRALVLPVIDLRW